MKMVSFFHIGCLWVQMITNVLDQQFVPGVKGSMSMTKYQYAKFIRYCAQ